MTLDFSTASSTARHHYAHLLAAKNRTDVTIQGILYAKIVDEFAGEDRFYTAAYDSEEARTMLRDRCPEWMEALESYERRLINWEEINGGMSAQTECERPVFHAPEPVGF